MKKRNSHLHIRKSMLVRLGAIASAVALGGCLAAGVAYADTVTDIDTSSLLPESFGCGLFSDYVSSSSQLASSSDEFPFALDLRHYNGTVSYATGQSQSTIEGGTNYVTPVKLQNPFGSCWAFACTAASETSMITELDRQDGTDGQLDGSVDYEKAASGEAGGYGLAASNLSERHLAYFSFSHPTKYGTSKSQAGEGTYLSNGSTDVATLMDNGGMLYLAMSIYSSGIGPVPEKEARYCSEEGWIQVPMPLEPTNGELIYKYFTSYDKALEYSQAVWTEEDIKNFNDAWGLHLTEYSVMPRIAKLGTWAVDQDKTYEVVAELCNSNIIESDKDENGALTEEEMYEMKRELNEGHPLSIAFASDQSRPGQINSAHRYINTDTWAQYTFEASNVNHAVTIVGYDDNYAASNFTHTVYKYDAELEEWVEDTSITADMTTPAGDGAWIVKNSWGSVDNENPLYEMNWGVEGSGYFYISYYDKSISKMESFEYDLSEKAQQSTGYISFEYDMANVMQCYSKGSNNTYKMCNVFNVADQTDKSVAVRDVSCLTGSPNATATMEIYVMDADVKDVASVIETSQPVATVSKQFDCAGFHRFTLDEPVVVRPDQKFAIVQTTIREDGATYEYTYNAGFSKTLADNLNYTMSLLTDYAMPSYINTVVNEGESLVYDGTWKDMNDVIPAYDSVHIDEFVAQIRSRATNLRKTAMMATGELQARYLETANRCENFTTTSAVAIDNWSIKAYADEIEDSVVYRLYNGATSEHLWTTDLNEYSVLTDYGWTQEGAAWESPEDGVGVIRLYNPVLSKHLYTTDANEVSVLTSGYGWVKDNNGDPVFYSAQDSETGDALEGAVAIYRLYNGALSQHLLTRDTNEYAVLPRYGWSQEGPALYALS